MRRSCGAAQAKLRVGTLLARWHAQDPPPRHYVRVRARHGQLHRCVSWCQSPAWVHDCEALAYLLAVSGCWCIKHCGRPCKAALSCTYNLYPCIQRKHPRSSASKPLRYVAGTCRQHGRVLGRHPRHRWLAGSPACMHVWMYSWVGDIWVNSSAWCCTIISDYLIDSMHLSCPA
jgi:hypothetical protein